nr:FliA/WhiG family RNA polymerase sigma factor [Ammoniphilus resinae]
MKIRLDSLWQAWQEWKDPNAREQLVERYLPLVYRTAQNLKMNLPQMIDKDDLVSWGSLGLLDALNKYEHARGLAFETYATTRIRGAMIDGMRDVDWVPRSVREKIKKWESAYRDIEQQQQRPPNQKEIGHYLGLSSKEIVQFSSQLHASQIVSLDQPASQDEEQQNLLAKVVDEQALNQQQLIEEEEEKRFLAQCIDQLPEKEKLVVSMIYYEELTFSETAEVMGLTTGRISQLHSKAMGRLRQQYASLLN